MATDDPLLRFLERPTRRRFATLVVARRDRVLQAAWRVTGDRDLAEDIAQEVFLKLLSLTTPAEKIRSPEGLLVRMAVNGARSRLRSEARRTARERARAETAGTPEGFDHEEIRAAVADLPDELRECVELRYFGGLSLAEVAAETGIALRTVGARLGRARERLRVRLGAPAYGGVLTFLGGDDGATLPRVRESAQLASRLAGVVRQVSSPVAFPVRAVVALALVAVAIMVGLRLAGGSGDAYPTPGPESEAVLVAGRTERADADAEPLADSGGEADDPSAAGRDERPRLGAIAPGRTGFVIEVVDAEGKLARAGTVEISFDGLPPSLRVLSELKDHRALLDPQPLDFANPFVATDLPRAAIGLPLKAIARPREGPPSRWRAFVLEEGKRAEIRLVVPAPARLPVTVIDRFRRQPIAGATVLSLTELRRRDVEPETVIGEAGPGTAVTGEDGTATIEGLGDSPHDIEVRADGYAPARVDGVATTGPMTIRMDRIGVGGEVAVLLRDPRGEPLPEVRVKLRLEGSRVPRFTTTDARGRVEFTGLPAGYHSVEIDFDSWFELLKTRRFENAEDAKLVESVILERGGRVEVALAFVPGSGVVTGVVRGPDRATRAGVAVGLSGPRDFEAVSDAGGVVRFTGVPAGEYRTSLTNPGDGESAWSIDGRWSIGDGATREFAWTAGDATIRGRVTDPDGAPLAGTGVSIGGPAWEFVTTGRDGRFVAKGAPPGTYELAIGHEHYVAAKVTVVVSEAGSPEPVEVRTVPGARLRIQVHDADRDRFESAALRLLGPDGDEFVMVADPAGEFDRVTGSLPPGDYEIEVAMPGRDAVRWPVTLKTGEARTVELRLP